MSRTRILGVVMLAIGLTFAARPVQAQEALPERLDFSSIDITPALVNGAMTSVRVTELEQMPMAPIVPNRPAFGGKALMNSLFATTAVVQALDVHSTLRALNAGAVEGNPLMAGVTKNKVAFVATKAAVAAAAMYAAKKMAKKNKVAAVVTLIAVNSAYAMIAAHNYHLAGRR